MSDVKKPSGAQYRKRKREQAERVALEDNPDFADDFKEAGEPDLENQGTDLAYVRKLQLIALKQMATTPFPSEAQQALWKRIREMSSVVGLTSNRAGLEAEVRLLKRKLEEHRAKLGTAQLVNGAAVPLPPTARNSGRARGPRPLPDDGAGPTKGAG